MAAAALAARTAAQTACELAVQYAERRHHHPGVGDINLTQLESALANARTKWANLETAQINYITKAAFATEEERTEELRSWLDKETAHEDWVASIAMIRSQPVLCLWWMGNRHPCRTTPSDTLSQF